MPDFVLSANLVNDEFRVTVYFEIFNPNFIGDLYSDQESIAFRFIIRTWFG